MQSTRHPRYARHCFPPEVISYAVWLYFRFPLSLPGVFSQFMIRWQTSSAVLPTPPPLIIAVPVLGPLRLGSR
jgi:hypothetical protein